jgi:hypothetical protein
MTYIAAEIEEDKSTDRKQIDMFFTSASFKTSPNYQTLHQMIPKPPNLLQRRPLRELEQVWMVDHMIKEIL